MQIGGPSTSTEPMPKQPSPGQMADPVIITTGECTPTPLDQIPE